jgi:hypothetical protein
VFRSLTPRAVLVVLELVVAAAAVYELADALGWLELGGYSGDGPAGEDGLVAAACVALLVAGVGALATAIGGGRHLSRLWVPLPLLGAAFVGARFYTYDPYYFPTLRRISDGGVIDPGWMIFVVGFSVCAAVLAALGRRVALPIVGITAILCGLTGFFAATGH